MVARELVRARRARGMDADLVTSVAAVTPDTAEPVLPVMRGKLSDSTATRVLGVLQGRLLGRRPSLVRAYEGLQTLTGTDVVLVHNRPDGLRASPAGAFRVLYLHNAALRHYSARELRRINPHIDLIVCVSNALADQVPSALVAPRAVVLNGVDAALFRPDGHAPGENLTVMYCGRVVPEKGVHVLIGAASRLRHLPFRVRVVGAGVSARGLSGYERRLRDMTVKAGMTDRITFERDLPRASIPQVMRSADVLSVPSVWPDPCPLVVLEGLASGLAVVAARTGGIPELGGSAVRYHEPGAADDLATQLEALLQDRSLLRRCGSAARRRALELSWETAETTLAESVTSRLQT